LIDLRLIIGSGYSPNALRLHLSPLFVYHASVNAVYGENWKNARLTSTDGRAFLSDSHPPVRQIDPAAASSDIQSARSKSMQEKARSRPVVLVVEDEVLLR
jgi:hypothetical protein